MKSVGRLGCTLSGLHLAHCLLLGAFFPRHPSPSSLYFTSFLWGVNFCKIWQKTFAELKNLAQNIDKVLRFFFNTLIIIIFFFVGV